jgi:hypothetical protein
MIQPVGLLLGLGLRYHSDPVNTKHIKSHSNHKIVSIELRSICLFLR